MPKAQKAIADRYLWTPPRSRCIWFQMAVPKAYRKVAGQRVVKCSLGTSDPLMARRLAAKKRAELFEEWSALPVLRQPSDDELEAAAVEVGYASIQRYEDDQREMLRGNLDEASWERQQRRAAINLDTQAKMTVRRDYAIARGFADIAIEQFGFDLEAGTERYDAFCDHINRARLAAIEVSQRRSQGYLDAETDSKLVARVQDREANTAKPGQTLVELFDKWAADCLAKGHKRSDTITQDRKIMVQFSDFVGASRAVCSITAVEVADYRDRLRELPPKWRSNRELRGLELREAAAKARALNLPQTAFTTVNKHLSTISPLYTWLAEQPAWAGLVNPCNGLHHKNVKGKNPRPPFSTEVLNKILTSPLFIGFLADGKEHLPGDKHADDWRRWIPLIALFTGARVGEIAQLRLGDIRMERGVWFMHICEDAKAGLMTKSRKSRPAALHSKLISMGLLRFHEDRLSAAKDDLGAALFPELLPNARGQISGKPSRWWRDYLTHIGIKDGADGYGQHSFRHTLADRLRSEAEVLDDQIEVILGHSQKTTTSGYGELPQGTVTMFKDWIERVTFEGVDFSHLLRE